MASVDVQPELIPTEFCAADYTGSAPIPGGQLTDYLENETKALDELWRVQGFPTPPTSPERVYTPTDDMEDSESDGNQDYMMLNELILLAYGEELLAEMQNPLVLSNDTDLQDKLIQDCMWSGQARELSSPSKKTTPDFLKMAQPPECVGGYTPAPSPPSLPTPSTCDSVPEEEEMGSIPNDYVSPSAVFMSLSTPTKPVPVTRSAHSVAKQTETKKSSSTRMEERAEPDLETSRRSKAKQSHERSERKFITAAMGTGGNSRRQPQADSSTSTSDEEIDVVTVPTLERTKLTRKRPLPFSAPCSRQGSPHPLPQKRKKYHTKRLQRLSSAGSGGDCIESDDEARRASHNVLERKRRNDLKSSFQKLREEIPELEDNLRAPKVTILKKAMDFIRHMQEVERAAEEELLIEQRRKARLVERLNQLRSSRPKCRI